MVHWIFGVGRVLVDDNPRTKPIRVAAIPYPNKILMHWQTLGTRKGSIHLTYDI